MLFPSSSLIVHMMSV